jgi:hypothetical protein
LASVAPIGLPFDIDAVLIEETAHQTDCRFRPDVLPPDALLRTSVEVYLSERCPRECACAQPFDTLLGYQMERELSGAPLGPEPLMDEPE